MTIEQQIRAYILQAMPEVGKTSFEDHDSLAKTGLVDSYDIVLVISFIEEKFGIKFQNEDITAANCSSVATLAAFVRARLSKRHD